MQTCGNEMDWYALKLNSICIPRMNMTWTGFDQCKCDGNMAHCFTDSGASWISLPLPESQCDYLVNTTIDDLAELGSLLLDIEGVNGTTVTLSLPLLWLAEQIKLGYVQCTGVTGSFIVGFPIFQHYYLAYDMEHNTVAFVDLQLSDETKAYLYDYPPELGGANVGGVYPSTPTPTPTPSSGFYHRMPTTTASNLMTVLGALLFAFQCIF